MKVIATQKVFSGVLHRVQHFSVVLQCEMTFSIFLPCKPEEHAVPVLYWLSGLTCTDENFCQKAGAFRYAQEKGIAIVCPDTSPRGEQVAGQDRGYDLGLGAGFYVDATEAPWAANYQMHRYVVEELPVLVENHFEVTSRRAIAGHSMGGHGAIVCALRHPDRYQSISAFAPILNPMQCPWGVNAFTHYLGPNQSLWAEYDSTELLKKTKCQIPLLIDQGDEDAYLKEQLKPDVFIRIAKEKQYPLSYRDQAGYDHSYYFISTFIADHIQFHAAHLV